ncbi:MAG: hemin uptake protein HemP [Rhodobacteraceae bacterium]|nr:hemin uptake protein HemP [Paracoccaceae bacterium]
MTFLARPEPEPGPLLPRQAEHVHDARVLTGGGSTALIVLDGQIYTLRITRAGKLILTK